VGVEDANANQIEHNGSRMYDSEPIDARLDSDLQNLGGNMGVAFNTQPRKLPTTPTCRHFPTPSALYHMSFRSQLYLNR
jgi:hypothetical protein